jgi:hypothetical protein
VIDYRAYLVGQDGHFDDVRAFASASDAEAIIRAKQLLAGYDFELWSGARITSQRHPAGHAKIEPR